MPATTKPHIVITGASGFIGSALAQHFSQSGYAVSALVRSLPKQQHPNLNYVVYHLEQPLPEMNFSTTPVFIHCAYSKQGSKVGVDANEIAAQHILQHLTTKAIQHCIFFSSLSASSSSNTYYAQQKKKIEQLLTGPNTSLLRPGLVIGKGGLFYNTFTFIKRFGLLPLIGKGNQPVYYIGIDDLVKICETLVVEKRVGCFYALHEQAMPYKQFYKTVAQQFQKRLFLLPLPIGLVKLAAKIYSALPRTSKITSDAIKGLQQVPVPDASILQHSVYGFELERLETSLEKLSPALFPKFNQTD